MVKNKALPDPARLCCTPQLVTHSLSLSLSLSLPLEDLALSRLVFCVFSLSLSLSLMPFIPRVPPGSCQGWTPAPLPGSITYLTSSSFPGFAQLSVCLVLSLPHSRFHFHTVTSRFIGLVLILLTWFLYLQLPPEQAKPIQNYLI